MNRPSISFIIPTYEDISQLERCIGSLLSHALSGFMGEYEIIIVDDGSSPHIQAAVAQLAASYHCKTILKPTNESYTRTVNIGLRSAQGDFCVLVNNDIVFSQEGWLLRVLANCFDDHQIGVVGCRLIYPNGLIQHGGMVFTSMTSRYRFHHLHVGKPRHHLAAMSDKPVIAVTGALMVLRRQMIDAVGLLDESYKLTCSDTDICLRALLQGWKVIYCGRAEAVHVEGGTRGNTPRNKVPRFALIEEADVDRFNKQWNNKLPGLIHQFNCRL